MISVKFGALAGAGRRLDRGRKRPAAIKNFLAYTLQRLGTDYIDIYRPARLDPGRPDRGHGRRASPRWSKPGYVRQSDCPRSAQTVRRASAVHPIADLQIEYSLISRGIEKEILPTAA